MYMTQPDRQHVQHIRDYCEEIREIIWETAVNDIPALKQFCEEQLAENTEFNDIEAACQKG